MVYGGTRKIAFFCGLMSMGTVAALAQDKAADPKPAASQDQTQQNQTQNAPPEVDQALRDRVTQFFQYHVDYNLRKAYDMVAEDTKDFYFAAYKHRYKSFRIMTVRFSDHFTKADVDVIANEEIQRAEFPMSLVPIPMTTHWKIENGLWMWYMIPEKSPATPMGDSDIAAIQRGGKVSPDMLPKLVSPDQLKRMADNILHQGGVDKRQVMLSLDKASSDTVTFHNAQPGTVSVTVAPGGSVPGFSATLDKNTVGPNEDAILKLSYDPSAAKGNVPGPGVVRLVVEPFDQFFDVKVQFGSAPPAAQ